MASSDEHLIINSLLFISVRENRPTEVKVKRVKSYLEDGADVNAADGNDEGNTVLHIAARRGDLTLAHLLVNNGADVTLTNFNGQTPLDIAQALHPNKEIVNLLKTDEKTVSIRRNTDQPLAPHARNNQLPITSNDSQHFKYMKRVGTSGVCGQLYETKLLSLVLMRALNDKQIENFLLGTNIRGIGDMDDICLRYRVVGQDRSVLLFVQAKHREDREKGKLTVEDVQSVSGDFSLRKYFESYLTIKDRFQTDNEDPMFEGDFCDIECNLVIYTPAKDYFTKKSTDRQVSAKIHYLINTGENTEIFQYDYDEEDIENLTKMTVIERLKKLGAIFLEIIMSGKDKLEMILADILIARYHVVLGREVLQPCKIQDANNKEYRLWEFRSDFFESNCDYLTALRKTFIKELSSKRYDQSKLNNEDQHNFRLVLQNPCPTTISKVISKLATYNDKTKKLQLGEFTAFRKKFKSDEFKELLYQFNEIECDENDIAKAIRMKMMSMRIKLPLSFGNLDMTFRGSEVRVQRRIKAVAEKLAYLLEINRETKILDINGDVVGPGKTIEQGIIDINGGIGSAVGNVLVLDPVTKMLKFDSANAALHDNAVLFLIELQSNLGNKELSNYRIKINVNGFPKDSFNGDEYDKKQARDFLCKLWFYANQAKEDEVEAIVKGDINELYNKEKNGNQFKFKIHADAIFLRSHDEIQKWWMETGEAIYLNRSCEFFERAKQAVIDNPLLTVLNFMYILKIQNFGIKFHQDMITDLNLGKINERLYNIITDTNLLTGIKIMQHFENQERYSFIDFDYVLSLPLNDYNTMRQELQNSNIETLIIVYEKLKYYEGLCNQLKEIIELFNGSKIVVVTDDKLAEEIRCYVGDKYRSIKDNKTNLIDLTDSCQRKVLKESVIHFQGDEIPLESLLPSYARDIVGTDFFQKLIMKEKYEIGHSLSDKIYKEINDFIGRSLSDGEDTYSVETLDDIKNDVVVVTGQPGMGKSALLTHVSLNTKKITPQMWIVRVNLTDHTKEFTWWREQNLKIDMLVATRFLCNLALKNFNADMKVKLDHIGNDVSISHIEGDIDCLALFELRLFLHLYNSGNVVFLFDDFSSIWPIYETEVLEMLKLLKNAGKRMWITTCPYNQTKAILVKEFGNSFKLEPLRTEKKKIYLERCFKTTMDLERLFYVQFENVRSFLKYMSKVTNMRLVSNPDPEVAPPFSPSIQMAYIMALKILVNMIIRPSAAKIKENFGINLEFQNKYSSVDEILGRRPDVKELELSGTPLHLFMAANHFGFRLQENLYFLLSPAEVENKWEMVLNSITLYQHYIEAAMKWIFHKEDADDDSIASTYRKAKKDFQDKLKMLDLLNSCEESDLNKFLKPDDIDEIRCTISKIQRGEDRSSLINCVVNGVSRLTLGVFAEYFGDECLVDIMKLVSQDSNQHSLKLASLWQSMLNLILFNAPPSIRKAFDDKLQTDTAIAELTKTDLCREVVNELLFKQDKRTTERAGNPDDTPLPDALEDGVFKIVNLFLPSAQLNLIRGNVDDVIGLLDGSKEKFLDFSKEYGEIIVSMIESIMSLNFNSFGDILRSGRLTDVPVRHVNDYCRSETASKLRVHIEAITSQVPVLAQNIQQLCQQNDVLKETVRNVVGVLKLSLEDS